MAQTQITDYGPLTKVQADPGRMEVTIRNAVIMITLSYAEALDLFGNLGDGLMSLQLVKDGPQGKPLSFPAGWQASEPRLAGEAL
jgi:hypothetical protein